MGCTPGCVSTDEGFVLYDWLMATIEKLRPIDACCCLGDAIDGRGEKSGGVELVERDRNEQAKIAAGILLQTLAKSHYMVCGTPYHSGKEECWDRAVGELVFAEHIADKMRVDFNGTVVDMKHKVGGTSIPHGAFTAAAKAGFLSTVDSARGASDPASVFIRGHRHSYSLSKAKGQMHIVLPGLQVGSRFCDREVDGEPDVGVVLIEFHQVDSSRSTTATSFLCASPVRAPSNTRRTSHAHLSCAASDADV